MSDETGTDQVYARSFPASGGKWPVSTSGGSNPVWAKNGQELFYRSGEGMMVVGYKVTGAAFEPASPRLWAAKNDLNQWFDLSPDGKRFMIVEIDTTNESPSTPVTLVLNFFEELRRRASDAK